MITKYIVAENCDRRKKKKEKYEHHNFRRNTPETDKRGKKQKYLLPQI